MSMWLRGHLNAWARLPPLNHFTIVSYTKTTHLVTSSTIFIRHITLEWLVETAISRLDSPAVSGWRGWILQAECLRLRSDAKLSQQRPVSIIRNISKAKFLTFFGRKLETAVASFFTPISKKKPEKITWRVVNKSLIAGKYTSGPAVENAQTQSKSAKRRKVAAFDLVCALITASAWIFMLYADCAGLDIDSYSLRQPIRKRRLWLEMVER